VHKSLRADGIFLTLTPIEIKDLFDFRTKFINTSRWSSAFEEEAKNSASLQLHKGLLS